MDIPLSPSQFPQDVLGSLAVCSGGQGCGCRFSRDELGAEGVGLAGDCPACSHPRAQHPGTVIKPKRFLVFAFLYVVCFDSRHDVHACSTPSKAKRSRDGDVLYPRPRKTGNGIRYSGEMAAPEVPPGADLQVPPVGDHRIAPLCQLPMFSHLRDGNHEHNRARGRCKVCKKTCAFYCVQCSTVSDDPAETILYTLCNMTRHPCFFNHLIAQQQSQQQQQQPQQQQQIPVTVVAQPPQTIPTNLQPVVGSNIIV